MVYCSACAKNVIGHSDEGFVSCSECGKVLKYDNFSTEATFVKNAAGQSQLAGRIVDSIQRESESRDRLCDRARDDMTGIMDGLEMGDSSNLVEQAMVYYQLALERNFTRGRRRELVQAACLYIACRENRKPYLLIDFSNYLNINVYALGCVFLQLCSVLNLTEHPICQKLLDPSIFIHKYTARLAKGRNKEVSDAALAIIASMNRDWMQTGRRPSGLWGAALFIAAQAHGIKSSKEDILRLVHVCEATLSKRLVEFENTESASLTIEELNAKAEELKESPIIPPSFAAKHTNDLLCQHKDDRGSKHFACGLCESCYGIMIGFDGGSDPPAFQEAERQRTDKLLSEEANEEDQHVYMEEIMASAEQETNGMSTGDLKDDTNDERSKGSDDDGLDEVDNLTDIDDAELDKYLIGEEEERKWKRICWEYDNLEYLEEEAAKKKDAETAEAAREANYLNCSGDLQAAKDLEAALAASKEKLKKERQKKRAADAKNATPAQSASEAALRMLTKKRLSSKINRDMLEKLFAEPSFDDENDAKKPRTDSNSDEEEAPRDKLVKDAKLNEEDNDELGTIDEEEEYEDEDGNYRGGEDYDGYDYEPEDENLNPDLEYDGF